MNNKPNILRPSKLLFSDFLKKDLKVSQFQDRKSLMKIEEVSESQTDEIQNDQETSEENIDPPFDLPASPRTHFLTNFLATLQRHPKVYKGFIAGALKENYLASKQPQSKTPNLNNSQKTVKSFLESISDNESSVLTEKPLSRSMKIRKGVMISKHWRFLKKPLDVPNTASSSSSIRRTANSTTVFNNIRSFRKKLTLNPADPELVKIFKTISSDRSKISNDEFKAYLSTRYPVIVAETMTRFFSFKYTSFEEYVHEMNKFVSAGEERHLNFCFEIFDFNRDKKITFQDTFKAMEIRTGNYYDEDLVQILDMFDIKNTGTFKVKPRQHRRKSTFSLIKDEKKKDLIEEELRSSDAKKRYSATSINYSEFCTIRFNFRPQIILDFFMFTCNYDYLSDKGFAPPHPVHSHKESENIVVEMNLNPESLERISKLDKYDYYCSLDTAMSLFSKFQLEDMLKKFKFLQSDEKLRLKVISKQSMIEKLVKFKQPALLGYNNAYLSEQFYECMSQGKDLTKAVFLSKCHSILSNPTSLTINRLAFDLIDSRKDGRLTVDEVHNIFEAIPSRSLVYQEVLM